MNTLTYEQLKVYLPLLIPLLILQVGLAIFAVYKIIKQQEFPRLNRPIWLVIVLLLQFVGPICYFVFGRGDEA